MVRNRLSAAASGDQSTAGEAGSGGTRAKPRLLGGGQGDGHCSGDRPNQLASEPASEPLLIGLEEAAALLGYTPIGLRKIVNRSRDKANGKTTGGPTIRFFQTCKSAPIKFRIEWIRDFIERYSVDPDAHDEASKRAAARRRASRPGLREGQYDHGF